MLWSWERFIILRVKQPILYAISCLRSWGMYIDMIILWICIDRSSLVYTEFCVILDQLWYVWDTLAIDTCWDNESGHQ